MVPYPDWSLSSQDMGNGEKWICALSRESSPASGDGKHVAGCDSSAAE